MVFQYAVVNQRLFSTHQYARSLEIDRLNTEVEKETEELKKILGIAN